ncbi:hypothetical protein NVP1101O_169 [Vibrio phage 1.101.O._10N.261.45.C6]|nr:hypothetical protein NVP1101O_169 [Vibrio phage 1.101.O._10N.261.45.C6]
MTIPLENNKYYWIKTDGIIHKYVPIYRNNWGSWCVDTESTRVFLSDYKLKLLYGSDCIDREVDFENDLVDMEDEGLQLYYFTFGDHTQVMYGNSIFLIYRTSCSVVPNDFENCKKLIFK